MCGLPRKTARLASPGKLLRVPGWCRTPHDSRAELWADDRARASLALATTRAAQPDRPCPGTGQAGQDSVLAKGRRGWPAEFQEPEARNETVPDFVRGPDFWGRVELERRPWKELHRGVRQTQCVRPGGRPRRQVSSPTKDGHRPGSLGVSWMMSL